MSLMDQTKDGSSIPSEITPRTSPLQSHSTPMQNIRLLSLTRPITPVTTYNSYLEPLLRNSQETVDSYSPAIIKIKSSNHYIPGVLLSNLASKVKRNKKLQLNSSDVLTGSWTPNGFRVIRKSS